MKEFKDPIKAFDFLYPKAWDGRYNAELWSDDHVGHFGHEDFGYFLTKDEEGKYLALLIFKDWLKEYKK